MTASYYRDLAAELRSIATDIEQLDDADIRGLEHRPYFDLHIQPAHDGDPDNEKVAVVDAVSAALLGEPGATHKMSTGSYHHTGKGHRGGISITVLCEVRSPEERELHAELERLRAQVAAQNTGPVRPVGGA